MKALLIKDFAYIRRSKLLGIVLILAGVFAFSGNNFAVTYLGIMSATMVQTSFSYDEYQGGMKYILTLPITRKQYVQSKYLLALVLGMIGTGIGMLVQMLPLMTGEATKEVFVLIPTSGMTVLLLSAVNIPMLLRFGAERGRLLAAATLIAVIVVVGAAVVVPMKMLGISPGDVDVWMACGVLSVVVAMALLISYFVSLRIIEKKEY